MTPQLLDATTVSSFVEDIDTFIFDCDGVLWHGNEIIEGVKETLAQLKQLGKRLLFVTNNSTKSTAQYGKKFKDLGIPIDDHSVYGPACVAALHLKNVLKVKKKVYMVGNYGIKEEIEGAGIEVIGVGPDPLVDHNSHSIAGMVDKRLDDEVEAVVVGFDSHFNLQKMARAMLYLQKDNMPFIATNTDAQFPMPDGRLLPGTGAIVAAVTVAAGRAPVVLGKPERTMFDAIANVHDVDSKRTLMIGDRLETDILFGKNCGLKTLCVLTGVTKESHLIQKKSADDAIIPDYYATSVGELGKHLPAVNASNGP